MMLKVNYEVVVVYSGAANQITVIEHARSLYETPRLDILARVRGGFTVSGQVHIHHCNDGVSRFWWPANY